MRFRDDVSLHLISDLSTLVSSLQSVQSVISNLLISHVELRSEESADIQAHSHQRTVEKVVVPPGETLSAYQARYLQVGARSGSVVTVSSCWSANSLNGFSSASPNWI